MSLQDVAQWLSLADQGAYELIKGDQFTSCQVNSSSGLPEFLLVFPVRVVRIVQVLVEQAVSGFRAGIADIGRLLFDLTRIIHEIRTPAVAGKAFSA